MNGYNSGHTAIPEGMLAGPWDVGLVPGHVQVPQV